MHHLICKLTKILLKIHCDGGDISEISQVPHDSFLKSYFGVKQNDFFSFIEEYYRKTEEFNKIIEEYKKKEEEAKNEKEDLRQKNQSQMYNKDYFHHPNKNHPEKNPFYFSKISFDKEFPSFSKKKNEFGEQISGDFDDSFEEDNILQDDNQKLYQKETKIFFDAKK
jgi:hypothetical protein